LTCYSLRQKKKKKRKRKRKEKGAIFGFKKVKKVNMFGGRKSVASSSKNTSDTIAGHQVCISVFVCVYMCVYVVVLDK
jgi:hypothetical protein